MKLHLTDLTNDFIYAIIGVYEKMLKVWTGQRIVSLLLR